MSEKIKNKIVVLEPSAKSAAELMALIKEKDLAEVVSVSKPDEAIQEVVSSLPCILVCSIVENSEVPTRVQMWKRLEVAVKNLGLKIYVVTPIKNRQLADMATQKLGVADYIVEPVPVRTMQFKINLQLKAVDNFRRQQEIKKLAEEKIVIKKLDNKRPDAAAAGSEVKTSQKPALQAGEDTFLFKNSGVKKAGKKFTVEMEGPAPETGEWVQHEDKGDAQSSWRWVPNEEKEAQASGAAAKDGWVHDGEKPVFNKETNKWAMTSEKPSLALKAKGQTVAQKMGLDEAGDVFVADDSPAAEENLKKNREKALALRPKKELKKDPVTGKEIPEEDEETTLNSGPNGGPAIKPKAPALEKKKRTAADLGLDDDDEEVKSEADAAAPIELRDRTGEGTPEEQVELQDKRSPQEAKTSAELKLKESLEGEDKEEEAAKPLSPLDFLKKKKDLAAATAIKAGEAPKGVNALKEDGAEEEEHKGLGTLKKLAKNKNDDVEDRLARLNASLNEDVGETTEEETLLGGEGTEEGEEEGPGGTLRIKKKAKGPLSAAEKLRDDPADEHAEMRDLQALGPKKKVSGLRQQKNKTLEEIQSLLKEPIPENISKEEEDQLREELGLKGRPEITPRELVKRKRIKQATALKSRLAQLEQEIAEEEAQNGEATSGLLNSDEDEKQKRNKGDLTPDKLTGIRQALDSGEEEEEEDEDGVKKRKKGDKDDKKKRAGLEDESFYMPVAELTPLGNAWDAAGPYYVYLDAKVRYKGFNKMDELLPLWTFQGEEIPQLLDKTKQWRFRGGKPVLAKTITEIPLEVREFLTGIRDQIAKNTQEEAAEEQDDLGLDAEDSEEEAADDSPLAQPKEKSRKDSKTSRLEALKASLEEDEDDSPAASDEEEEESSPEESEELESEQEKDRAEDEKDREKSTAESRMERLRKQLNMDSEEGEENASDDENSSEGDSGEDTRKSSSEKAGDSGEKADLSALAAKLEKASQSAGVQEFMERRKQKTEAKTAEEAKAPRPASAPPPGFLGIYVVLSDAYALMDEPKKSISRVLNALEGTFRNCTVYCVSEPDTEGNAMALFHATGSATDKVPFAAGMTAPITSQSSGTEKVLGYLYITFSGTRKGLDEREGNEFRKVAHKLWPILEKAVSEIGSEKSAA